MKKWNCNIVKDMYDRVIHRKYGLLCSDDTSNEAFLESYRNRLDCEIVDVSCYGNNKPCTTISFVECGFSVNITYEVVEDEYIFTATPFGNVGAVTYTWDFNGLFWNLISQTGNTLTLQPLYPIGGSFVSVLAIDSRDCPATDVIKNVNYLAGCTDPDAINYNPNATYNDGSCYYTPLTLTAGYTCDEFENGDFCATVTGGVPPYTLVGYPGGGEIITTSGGSYCEFILNGNPWSLYAIDSDGNVTPINTGAVACPFNCESVTIIPDVTIDCLIDGLGNATGQGQVFASPFGGTAPYTITISVNGNPAVPFVNGSIYNHDDDIEIFVVDANGCEGYFMEKISCPPTVPGEFFGSCEELAEYLKDNSTVFPVTVIIMNSAPNLGPGYTVDYTVTWGAIGVPAPLTLANFSTVVATIENITTTNLVIPQLITLPFPGSYGIVVPFTGNLVLNNSVSILSTYTTAISCGGSGLRSAFVPPSSPNLQLSVKLEFTVVIGSLVCHLCGSALFSLDYDPCENPFTPVSQTVNLVVLSVCP